MKQNGYEFSTIGIAGLGAMGGGIAEVALKAGCTVFGWDQNPAHNLEERIRLNLEKAASKNKFPAEQIPETMQRLHIVSSPEEMASCDLIIEAIVENRDVKAELFRKLEAVVGENTVLASNTSSLSIASLGSVLKNPGQFIGIHFFNPATLMKLVEVIPGVATNPDLTAPVVQTMKRWGKIPVTAKDTPGFIVNRIARPFYGEAIRIYEEGIASFPQIDLAMKNLGFRMGPFELMDFIGNDVNYAVTESVFREFWFDPRYKPSFTQKRLVEAGRLGRKSGQGYYNYAEPIPEPTPLPESAQNKVQERMLAMLMNEAADACYLGIASAKDIDLAMQFGVNYPKGLLQWIDEWSAEKTVHILDELYDMYHEDRYRVSPLLRKMKAQNLKFFP